MSNRTSLAVVGVLLVLIGILSGMLVNDIVYGYNPDNYIVLAEYKGLTFTPEEISVTDEDVEEKIDYYLSEYAQKSEVTSGAEKGDVVNIDYTTVVDSKEQSNIKDDDVDYTLGNNYFLDGFDEKLIGSKAGDVLKFTLTFPDDYTSAEYASKDIEFTVTVNSVIRETTPKLNDEYAMKIAGIATVAQFKEHVKSQIIAQKEKMAEFDARYSLWNELVQNTTVSDYPAKELRRCKNHYSKPYEDAAAKAGYTDLEKYLMDTYSATKASFDDYVNLSAKNLLKQEMIEKAIGKRENLEITDEYINNRKAYYAEMLSDDIKKYTSENVHTAGEFGSEENLMTMIRLDLVLDVVEKYSMIV